jgi:hypothetical protein
MRRIFRARSHPPVPDSADRAVADRHLGICCASDEGKKTRSVARARPPTLLQLVPSSSGFGASVSNVMCKQELVAIM